MAMKSLMAGAVLILGLGGAVAQADTISDVENARAKERAGRYLNGQDREQLRRHGGNDDGYSWRDGYGDYDYDRPGVSVYVGPRNYDEPYRY